MTRNLMGLLHGDLVRDRLHRRLQAARAPQFKVQRDDTGRLRPELPDHRARRFLASSTVASISRSSIQSALVIYCSFFITVHIALYNATIKRYLRSSAAIAAL